MAHDPAVLLRHEGDGQGPGVAQGLDDELLPPDILRVNGCIDDRAVAASRVLPQSTDPVPEFALLRGQGFDGSGR